MAINILNLKQQKVRKTIKIGDEVVEIYNITKENRHIFDEVFESNLDYETGEINISDHTLIVAIYTTLTNLEFQKPEELLDALDNPSVELEIINNELRLILTEFANSKIKDQLVKIQELEMILNQVELSNETEALASKASVDQEMVKAHTEEQLKAMRSSNTKKAGKGNAGKKSN